MKRIEIALFTLIISLFVVPLLIAPSTGGGGSNGGGGPVGAVVTNVAPSTLTMLTNSITLGTRKAYFNTFEAMTNSPLWTNNALVELGVGTNVISSGANIIMPVGIKLFGKGRGVSWLLTSTNGLMLNDNVSIQHLSLSSTNTSANPATFQGILQLWDSATTSTNWLLQDLDVMAPGVLAQFNNVNVVVRGTIRDCYFETGTEGFQVSSVAANSVYESWDSSFLAYGDGTFTAVTGYNALAGTNIFHNCKFDGWNAQLETIGLWVKSPVIVYGVSFGDMIQTNTVTTVLGSVMPILFEGSGARLYDPEGTLDAGKYVRYNLGFPGNGTGPFDINLVGYDYLATRSGKLGIGELTIASPDSSITITTNGFVDNYTNSLGFASIRSNWFNYFQANTAYDSNSVATLLTAGTGTNGVIVYTNSATGFSYSLWATNGLIVTNGVLSVSNAGDWLFVTNLGASVTAFGFGAGALNANYTAANALIKSIEPFFAATVTSPGTTKYFYNPTNNPWFAVRGTPASLKLALTNIEVFNAPPGRRINYGLKASGATVGITNGGNAAAGIIGEYQWNGLSSSTPLALSTGVTANVTNLVLTAGDWDVQGIGGFTPGGATTIAYEIIGISTNSATFPAVDTGNRTQLAESLTGGADTIAPTPIVRINVTANITVYLVAQGSFGVSTLSAYGGIRARRIR